PAPMDDPCNVAPASQPDLIPSPLAAPCASTYTGALSTIASDRDDLDGVVDYVRSLRHVDRLNLVAWSRGGARAGGYAGIHPEKIDSLVLLAPVYQRGTAPTPTTPSPVMNFTTRQSSDSGWDGQVGCADQFDPLIRDPLWSQLLESDPTGAAW